MSINRYDCDKKYNDKGGRRGKRDKYEKLRLDQIVDNLDLSQYSSCNQHILEKSIKIKIKKKKERW